MLSVALNHYLALDPDSSKRLLRLNNKVIAITLLPFSCTLQCHILDEAMTISRKITLTPDVTITGTPLALLGVSLNKSQRHRFFADGVTMTGDSLVAEQFIQLLDQLDIDWEEKLSHFIGDIPAHHIGKWFGACRQWVKQSVDSMQQNIRDYVQEEKNWLPTREALQDFYQDVDALVFDVDRLVAKVERITSC